MENLEAVRAALREQLTKMQVEVAHLRDVASEADVAFETALRAKEALEEAIDALSELPG